MGMTLMVMNNQDDRGANNPDERGGLGQDERGSSLPV
jgi:hypothetical protein